MFDCTGRDIDSYSHTHGDPMKRALFLVLLSLFLAAWAIAQENTNAVQRDTAALKTDGKTVTLKGYIVDAMCAKGMVKKGDPMQKAAGHTRECALEDACAAAGYGIFSDGKWVKFDGAGDRQAKAAIEKTKREKGLMFEVRGTMEGDKLAVASIKEPAPERKMK
jgi:hypothetical protein